MEKPEILEGINLTYGNEGFLGTVESFTAPKIAFKTKEFGLGGSIGTEERSLLKLEKLEAEITLREASKRVLNMLGGPLEEDLVLWGSVNDGSAERGHKIILRGYVKSHEDSEFKDDADISTKLAISVNFYQRFLDGEEILCVDLENSILKINGVDKMEKRRKNLGL